MARRSPLDYALRRVRLSARNALELVRLGRLSEPYSAEFEVVAVERVFKLRRYGARSGPPVLLVPPLMVASEIYDIAPELSAVGALRDAGLDVFVCDFGAPERQEGGMERTLDDHVRAVSDAIDRVLVLAAQPVHVAGYSQGGMFCYQAAAYRRSEGLASVITFGSPVDIHRNLPRVADGIASQLIHGLQRVVEPQLARIEGLPGFLTSTGFKLLSVRKEAQQLADFVVKLHDRQALERREGRRRFLAGEGFVAWPGPALRKFVDEFIVQNRMLSGGFVIDGRTVSLADIRCPVLYFVGDHDDLARPPAVRAIRRAVPDAEIHEVQVPAGHFGLVVGTTSQTLTWPTVIEWVRWKSGVGARPSQLTSAPEEAASEVEDAAFEDVDLRLFVDAASDVARGLWRRAGRIVEEASEAAQGLRVQLPRLAELERMTPETRVSMARVLADQAARGAERTFFLWRGRAFTYGDADRRVGYVARGLVHLGARHGDRVAVLMQPRPSYLTIVAALNRIGAVAVLVPRDASPQDVGHALRMGEARVVVVDPEHVELARATHRGPIWCLGGGPERRVEGVVDMERIDPHAVELPGDVALDAGTARDLAMVLFTPARSGGALRAARVTNGRWAFSAIGTAAATTLTDEDTVYAALPLHHASGMLVAVGSALAGGSRLALASATLTGVLDDPTELWTEIRRYGATIVYYAGEMCRPLVNAPFRSSDPVNPVRLFAGSGMRPDVWRRVMERFEVGVMEFYASTEATGVLANASGEKVGALGRPLPGSAEMVIVEADFHARDAHRDDRGLMRPVHLGKPGLLLVALDETHPSSSVDPRLDPGNARLRRNVFVPGDAWQHSGDIVYRDDDGDHWFLGRLEDVVVRDGLPVFSRPIEDALDAVAGVAYSAVLRDGDALVACLLLLPRASLNAAALERALRAFSASAWPDEVRLLETLVMTEGFRPARATLLQAAPRHVFRCEQGRVLSSDQQDVTRQP